MKYKSIILIFITILILLSSCQEEAISIEEYENQQVDSIKNSQSKSTFSQLKVIPYQYSLTDIGNGLERGVVYLAVENGGTSIINADDGYFIKFIVETEEGVNYENTASFSFDNFGNIPPGIRFYDTAISWESSQAATPKRIIITTPQDKNAEISFDLPPKGTSIDFPYSEPPKKINSIKSLENTKLINNEDGLSVQFTGSCYVDKSNRVIYLEVLITNNDKFYPHHVKELPRNTWQMSALYSTKYSSNNFHRSIDPDGRLRWSTISDDIGPNQSHLYNIGVGYKGAIAMVWIEGNDYSLYDLSECK